MNCLLDTSFVLELFRSNPLADAAFVESRVSAINLIILGELLVGGDRRQPVAMTRAPVDEFLQSSVILGLTPRTSAIYADLLHASEVKGLRVPDNDLWIAATAVEHDLTLLTFDRHFAHVDDVKRVIL